MPAFSLYSEAFVPAAPVHPCTSAAHMARRCELSIIPASNSPVRRSKCIINPMTDVDARARSNEDVRARVQPDERAKTRRWHFCDHQPRVGAPFDPYRRFDPWYQPVDASIRTRGSVRSEVLEIRKKIVDRSHPTILGRLKRNHPLPTLSTSISIDRDNSRFRSAIKLIAGRRNREATSRVARA